jgi:hypothetical protein
MVLFDSTIAAWQNKLLYDSVRPFSAIRHVYGSAPLATYAASAREAVTDLPADEFASYVPVADHSDHPSTSACICNALAGAMRLYFGTEALNFTRPVPAGSSRVEPGSTPAQTLALNFPTWQDFADACGQSRIDAGLHFPAAVAAASACEGIGKGGYAYWQTLIDGTAPARGPSKGLPADGAYWWTK